jgi:[NiFe] hydrogenase diaphorase moiety small subunit
MSETITFTIDGVKVQAVAGQTILQAADEAGVYIPRLCAQKELTPFGSCRVCTVMVDGRPQTACTYPAGEGIQVENDTETLRELRRDIIDMLFVEGNHYCMFCEASGDCELQALAYRFGITAPKYPYMFPKREIDMTHPDIFIDRDRCILCARCIRSSKELDGKNVFGFVGRGPNKRIAVNAEADLADTDAAGGDQAPQKCPVGALMRKGTGAAVPVGQRTYDKAPIGSDIEQRKA